MENEDLSINNIIAMIEGEFTNGQVREINSEEMISRLKEKGIKYVDIDKALIEAERRKIVQCYSELYRWIEPSEREARKRMGKKKLRLDWDIEAGGPGVYYRVIATYRIKEFLLSLLSKEWDLKGEEYRNLRKASWSLQTLNLKDINLDHELLEDEKFQSEVKERIDYQKDRISCNEPIMPLVVMYDNKMLMDGYARFFALRELGIYRARVYYGEFTTRPE